MIFQDKINNLKQEKLQAQEKALLVLEEKVKERERPRTLKEMLERLEKS